MLWRIQITFFHPEQYLVCTLSTRLSLPPSQPSCQEAQQGFFFFSLARCFSCFCCSKTHRSSPGSRLQILSCAANDQHLHPRLIKEVGKDTASKKAEIPFFNCLGLEAKHLFPGFPRGGRGERVDCSVPPVYWEERGVGWLTEHFLFRTKALQPGRDPESPLSLRTKGTSPRFWGSSAHCDVAHAGSITVQRWHTFGEGVQR